MCHTPGASWRQMDEKRPMHLPLGSKTGPVLIARVPESSASTRSGFQEKGAPGFS